MLSRSLEMGQALQLHKACIFVSFSQRQTPLPTFCRFFPLLCHTISFKMHLHAKYKHMQLAMARR